MQKLCECGCGAPVVSGKRFVHAHNNRLRGPVGHKTISSGYVLIKMPDHPRANSRGYVREHILVLEKLLGRLILLSECPHHRNEIRSDNSPGNLMLFKTGGMHRSYHERMWAFEKCGHYDWRTCMYCHCYDDPQNMKSYKGKTMRKYYHAGCHREYDKKRYHRIITTTPAD